MDISINRAYMSINVTELYEGWLSGLSQNQLREKVKLPDGRKPSKSGIRYWIIKAYGSKAFDRKANSLRRSLYQDLLRGKLKVPAHKLDDVKRWIVTSPESDLSATKFYAEGELYRDASRNFEFKPEIHLTETEEDAKIFQLVTRKGFIWSESEHLDELLTAGITENNGKVWADTEIAKGVLQRVYLFPACKLV